jgi:hypothetical protein
MGGVKMPEEIQNQMTHLFNSMGSAIFITALLYFILPYFGILIVSRFVFKIKGKALQFISFVVALGCFYFFAIKGLPEMQNIFSTLVK